MGTRPQKKQILHPHCELQAEDVTLEATVTTQYLPDRLESRATLAATRVRKRVASSRGRRGSALQPFGQKDCLCNIQSLYDQSCTEYCNVADIIAVFYSYLT
jgi:hypothetical protein